MKQLSPAPKPAYSSLLAAAITTISLSACSQSQVVPPPPVVDYVAAVDAENARQQRDARLSPLLLDNLYVQAYNPYNNIYRRDGEAAFLGSNSMKTQMIVLSPKNQFDIADSFEKTVAKRYIKFTPAAIYAYNSAGSQIQSIPRVNTSIRN